MRRRASDVGSWRTRLRRRRMDIAKTLKDAVDAGDVPGVAAAAATDKGVIFEGGAGVLRPDSVIWIASMTKAVTAAAAMQLVERGKLTLDGPASDIVPELGDQGRARRLRFVGQGDHAQAQAADHPAPSADAHVGPGLRHLERRRHEVPRRRRAFRPSARARTRRSPRRCWPSRASAGSTASRSTGRARWSRRRAASGSTAT